MSELLNGLNPVQQEIVKDTEGQLLVLAGAGSGKTRVLTHRIAYLIQEGNVKPWNILAVTFTNKAAREMRQRVVDLVGSEGRDIWIGTFHGICVRILMRFGKEIGHEKFTIIDDKEQKKIIKEASAACGIDFDVDIVAGVISNAKNDLLTPEGLQAEAKEQHERDIANVYMEYENKKNELGYFDFDDLIMKTVHLLNVSEVARNTYQHQFRYILTDETQDTNKAQFQLLTLLSAHHENLFAVGDADQSIYKWRGAQISNIINFQQYFPDVKLYLLEQNYRSTRTIVEASNALIGNNKERLEKTAFAESAVGDPITIYQADDDGREADFIAALINRTIHLEPHRSYNDFAVIYRTNRQSRAVEVALTQLGVPYQVIGGHAFYDRKEIKDLVAYLRAVANGVDALAFQRIINVPKRGIGDTTVGKIADYAVECGIPFPKALDHIDDVPKIAARTKNKIKEFNDLIKELVEYAGTEEFKVAELIKIILQKTQYLEQYDEEREEDATRIENVQELINVAGKWDEDMEEGKGLSDFLAETSLVSDVDGMEEETNMVTLMTGHASKGLEFPIVFGIGLEETIFPHGRSLNDPSELEEERRLMYVLMTRAEEKLYLSHCKQRYEYGNPRPIFNRPSRFLREIPERFVRRI
jgi:DNA helicase II / ATP-dependent DNA helicase PcrA